MVFCGELGVPFGIPIEVAVLLAGAYTVHNDGELVAGLLLLGISDALGTSLLYYLVRAGSGRIINRFLRKQGRDTSLLDRWEDRMRQYGTRTVLAGRMLPMVRMYITIAAGITRMPFGRFLVGELPAGTIWAGAPLAFGYFFRDDVHSLISRYTSISHAATLILPAIGPIVALAWWIQRGSTPKLRLHRLRAVLSVGMSLVIYAYLFEAVNHLFSGQYTARVPLPLLLPWLLVLLVIATTVLVIGFADLRTTVSRHIKLPHPIIRWASLELRTTLFWFALIVVAGIIIAGLEVQYPTISVLYR